MTSIRRAPPWEIPEREATPERVYLTRRQWLAQAGALGAGLVAGATAVRCAGAREGREPPGRDPLDAGRVRPAPPGLYPAARNPSYALDRPVTDEAAAARYNNFYEFTTDKDVYRYVGAFEPFPWTVEITGLVNKPVRIDIDDILKTLPLEERLYRFRCVEAWAMAVPWTGFTLKALLDLAEPLSSARYVRMVSFLDPERAPGQKATWFAWPYYEGLSMAEAMNELAFIATGIYGHPLPKQHGAPLRLVVPWKYGFKSAKSIVRFDLTAERPRTFWNDQAPTEYDFDANVNPEIPHPRWSQARERLIDTGEMRDTQIYNGYGPWVAHLYT